MIWLEEYHINKYVKKYDARTEGRYLNPPKILADFKVGDRVVIIPQGRYKNAVNWKDIGKIADITNISDYSHKISGRKCELTFLNGKKLHYWVKEINLKLRRSHEEIS